MDIYKQAEEIDADYMDDQGNIYKIKKYNRALRSGSPNAAIEVFNSNEEFLGFAQRIQ